MPAATHPVPDKWRDHAYDLTKGIATYTDSKLIAGLARVIAKHPHADIATAFNRKQVACKLWARDRLFEALGGRFKKIWILGGWYGVLAAMLFDDPRFSIELIESIDIDPEVAAIANTLNRDEANRFHAPTQDMHALDYAASQPDLVINTSCEHIPTLQSWLELLPKGTPVLLQSNNYFAEPSHINCMPTLTAFAEAARLNELQYSGELPQKNYTRFMLIGRV